MYMAGSGLVQAAPLMFERDIRPILKAHCFHCHGEEKEIKGGLDVRLKHFMEKGGDSGPAIVSGDPHNSLLIEQLKSGDMPKGGKKLPEAEIAKIEQWIAEGTKTLRTEPAVLVPGTVISEEERAYWAFQPIRRQKAPTSEYANPVDGFLQARLTKAGLAFSPETDRVTLIRRASFDLTGLPPSAEEVEAFEKDTRVDAYERLIDRLLESPQYGERWGRHWLDVAGYADSEGYNDEDTDRDDAWRYRDYVIQALNEDLPFDEFIREQLAGDEMIPSPPVNLTSDQTRKLTATGFLRMAPDGTGTERMDKDLAKNAVVTETVKIVSSSLMGMTVGCAECHDHRFDPILQKDFYRLRAIFEPALDWKQWREPRQRRISLLTTEERATSAELEKQAVEVEKELQAKLVELRDWVFEQEVKALAPQLQLKCREAGLAFQKDVKSLTAEQKKLVEEYPGIKVTPSVGILNLFLNKYGRENDLKKMQDDNAARAAAIRAKKPQENFVRVLAEPVAYGSKTTVPVTQVFMRGNRELPGDAVGPGDLTVLSPDKPIDFLADDPAVPGTGRRLAFAKHLTSGKHPLLARVLVNRFWMHHFGRGLVNTPGDFGHQGEKPSHPELLDWLANEFMSQGWSLKRLHRLVMTSAAYRQSSKKTPTGEARDPANALLWRYPVRRLEAEVIRDATLAVCGTLNIQPAGPPVPVRVDENNQTVVGSDKPLLPDQLFRRSIYVTQKRSLPAQVLAVFDAPQMEPNCELRNSSTVAPQSLLLMNSAFVVEQADFLAKRVRAEAGGDVRKQAELAWRLVFGVPDAATEVDSLASYLTEQAKVLKGTNATAKPEELERRALASLCQVLLGSNRFLYVE
ncbi:cytochrome c [Roseimicrobium gellanilyticum]|uniref:Cytochrome c n=2 Tax=Roseimicrobium gellanilyticum TaxID=748857 RepID=A0A366H709_9BACT|nr:cytochrome c [Roseimicrobium gellanilyticum]